MTRRMAAQLSDEDKVKAADYVIDNSGSLDETKKHVSTIYQKLKLEALRLLGTNPDFDAH